MCEDGIEIFVPRIAVWNNEVCRKNTNDDSIGNDGLFYPILTQIIDSLCNTAFHDKLQPEVPKYAGMRHNMMASL